MSDGKRQYRITGCITLQLNADYFHNELPKSDILEYLVTNSLSNSEIEVVSSQTNSIYIKDKTR